ncbi:MAG: MFS transporter, partial [Deltaproteobacteria bacterium]|nr:MFS transporter [Deltaproteobacteria bacterium]
IWPFCGAFFFLFSIPLIVTLPPERSIKTGVMSAAKKGLDELLKLVRKVLKDRNLKYFLLAYLFYEDGINTVIVFSSIYASFTFGFGQAEIVQLYLSTQLSAMLGAFIIARFIESIGYKRTLSLSLVAWIIITITAAISSEKWQFGLACLTGGFFLGILQASSRALFATFIPKVEVSKYFGLYSLVGKSSSIIGPASFGAISYLTGSQRIAAIFVSTLFIFGLIVLGKVKEKSC